MPELTKIFSLEKKKILVTGASGSIGSAVAQICIAENADLIITGRDTKRLQEVTDLFNNTSQSKFWVGDLTNELNLDEMCDFCDQLDGLVLNAGIVKISPVQFIKTKDLTQLFETNILSSIKLVQKLLKRKKIKQGASIVFVSSISTRKATIGNAMYNASKGAVNSFTQSLALELAPKKIRVNAVLPGFVVTNILGGELEDMQNHLLNYPLGRFGDPLDVAYLIKYLLSDASSWMTGSLIPIDGGFSLK